jgi:nucleoside-diphosphate-sugar epimerase
MINKYSKVLYIPPINKDSKVLVIGGYGFIGSWLCKRLLKMGVTNLDIYDIGEPTGNPSKEVIRKRKEGLPESLPLGWLGGFERGVWRGGYSYNSYNYVFHLGSYAGIRSNRDPLDYIKNNVNELKKHLRNIRADNDENYMRYIYVSSSSVLGDVETPYSLSKKMAEQSILDFQEEQERFPEHLSWLRGTPISIVRPFTVYGELGRPDMFISKLISGKKIMVNGDPSNINRRFTYVEDLIDILISTADRGYASIVNALGKHEYSLEYLLKLFGNEYEVVDEDPRDFKNQDLNSSGENIFCQTKIEDVLDKLRGDDI